MLKFSLIKGYRIWSSAGVLYLSTETSFSGIGLSKFFAGSLESANSSILAEEVVGTKNHDFINASNLIGCGGDH